MQALFTPATTKKIQEKLTFLQIFSVLTFRMRDSKYTVSVAVVARFVVAIMDKRTELNEMYHRNV